MPTTRTHLPEISDETLIEVMAVVLFCHPYRYDYGQYSEIWFTGWVHSGQIRDHFGKLYPIVYLSNALPDRMKEMIDDGLIENLGDLSSRRDAPISEGDCWLYRIKSKYRKEL